MARHARLVPPAESPRQQWPWHTAKWGAVSLASLSGGDRRLEGEAYLATGHGLRSAIERKPQGWRRFADVASTWQPSRLKGIQIADGEGTPFLAATQVFDIRPVPRKWLALERTPNASHRFVQRGQILVTCSGAVGRATLAYAPHQNVLISHDLLRVDPRDPAQRGWIYAYLRAPQTRAMMSSAKYGHIIKHLEAAHLDALPVPDVDDAAAADFERRVVHLLELRDKSYHQTLDAERLFEEAIGPVSVSNNGEAGFAVSASSLAGGRRRLDGAYHSPVAKTIREHMRLSRRECVALGGTGYLVWVPGRYRRIPVSGGVRYFDSSDLLEVAPDNVKRLADCGFGDRYHGRVRADWLLMPCSGQVYGIIGSVVMAGAVAADDIAVSNHVVRIAPSAEGPKAGYVLTAMSHPTLGRPLLKAMAFGSSVPELDPDDAKEFPLLRLDQKAEDAIANLADASAAARAEADALERVLAEDAGHIIDRFIAGDKLSSMNRALRSDGNTPKPARLAEHARVRLRNALPAQHLRAGATGTVVYVYRGKHGLEVEFGASGPSPKVVTLDADAVEPVAD